MMSDSNHSPRFTRRSRPFQAFRVNAVERLPGEAAVRGRLGEKDVELRYTEASGEFRLVTADGEDTGEVTRSDLRDIGPAIARYQQTVPWVDSVTGHVLKAVNDAVFPTTLGDFAMRSVSDLGSVVLLAGCTPREDIDVLLDARSGELTVMVTSGGRKAARRPLTSQEAWDLAVALRARIEGRVVTTQRSLVALVAEAARRQAHH